MTAKERRVQIVDAAVRAIIRHGVSGFRLRDVAAEAGVSQPLVSMHFRSREELIAAAFQRTDERALTHLLARSADAENSAEALREQLLACLDSEDDPVIAEAYQLWLELWTRGQDVLGVRDAADARQRAWTRRIVKNIRAAIEDGSADPDTDADLAAAILNALVNGLATDVRWGEMDLDTAAAALDRVLAQQLGIRLSDPA